MNTQMMIATVIAGDGIDGIDVRDGSHFVIEN
jgi:hypothetical protein